MASVKAGETPSETHINGYNTARATLLDLGVVVPSVAELIAPPEAPVAPVQEQAFDTSEYVIEGL
jgi:hypothetical protein